MDFPAEITFGDIVAIRAATDINLLTYIEDADQADLESRFLPFTTLERKPEKLIQALLVWCGAEDAEEFAANLTAANIREGSQRFFDAVGVFFSEAYGDRTLQMAFERSRLLAETQRAKLYTLLEQNLDDSIATVLNGKSGS